MEFQPLQRAGAGGSRQGDCTEDHPGVLVPKAVSRRKAVGRNRRSGGSVKA